jgi:hypothetical protein
MPAAIARHAWPRAGCARPAAQKAGQLRGVLHRHVEAGHGARGGAVHGDQAIETVRRFVGQRHQKRRHPPVALPRCVRGQRAVAGQRHRRAQQTLLHPKPHQGRADRCAGAAARPVAVALLPSPPSQACSRSRRRAAGWCRMCRQLDLFSEAIVAIDGSKFKAVNNRDKNFTPNKIQAGWSRSRPALIATADDPRPPQIASSRHSESLRRYFFTRPRSLPAIDISAIRESPLPVRTSSDRHQ